MQKLNFNKIKNLQNYNKMPQVEIAFNGWEVSLTLIKVIQNVIEGDLSYEEQKIDFKGVWQPLSNEQLELKPEGQRSWQWIWIHARSGTLNLETADKVIFNNKKYKVMQLKDYSLNGYIEYQLVEDYEENLEEVDNAKID